MSIRTHGKSTVCTDSARADLTHANASDSAARAEWQHCTSGILGNTLEVPKQPTDLFRFTLEDEGLMSAVGATLAANGFALERSAGPVDYYRIINPGSGKPRWIVARRLDGGYQLYSGNLGALKAGAGLRDVLLTDWLPAS